MQAKAMEKSNMVGLLQWMNKVASETPMRLETDLDDIVEQYYNEKYKRQNHEWFQLCPSRMGMPKMQKSLLPDNTHVLLLPS